MTNRRAILGILGGALAASAQTPKIHAETINRQPLPPPFQGWEAEFVSVTMPPGPGSGPHQHNGFVLGYVIEGEFRFAIDDQPETVLRAGETFYEPPGAHHRVSASASATTTARVLAIIISEKHKNG